MITRRFVLVLATWMVAYASPGQEIITNIKQGTNMALALSPDGETIVVDLVGQLWEIPVTGGAAAPLTAVGGPSRNPRFSPSGDRIVYQKERRGQWDLWLLDTSAGTERRLTGPPFDEREPEFSADGRSVVYASDRAGSFDIWELNVDSGEIVQKSRQSGNASFPSISDRGDLGYANQQATAWELNVLQPDGSSLSVLESGYPLRAPSWRPGGGLIIYSEQRGQSSNDLKMLLLGEPSVIKTLTDSEDVFGFRPAWSSPGEYLYTADGQIWKRTLAIPERSPVLLFAGIGLASADHPLRVNGHAPTGPQVATGIRAPTVSSSGRYRAFTALGDLWLQDTEGETRRLTDDPHVDIDPSFSPAEDAVVFSSDRSGDMDLWRLLLDTNELEQLTNDQVKNYRPAVSPDGTQVAYLRTRGFGPWSESSLQLQPLSGDQRARTLAVDLIDASTPVWDDDSMGVMVRTSRPPAALNNNRGPGSTHVDLRDRGLSWVVDEQATTLTAETEEEERHANPSLEWTPAPAEHRYVVQVDRLFDGIRNQYRRHMDIHVENGRITDIVARGILPLPEIVIDALDQTIIPGLIDIHTHQSALGGERLGRIWMAYGVTTVRETGGNYYDGMERREAWASGKRIGPRLLLTSVGAAPGREIETNDASGFDIIELNARRPDRFAAAQFAIATGLPIFSDRLMPAARFGINGLEHIGSRSRRPFGLERSLLNRTYQDVLSILTETRTAVTPALTAFGGLPTNQRIWTGDSAYTEFYRSYERSGWQNAGADRDALPALQQTIANLVRAGGRVTTGSDSPAVPYGLGLHAELALLAEAGLANDQVLRLTTADAALTLGLERDLGTLEPGKLADFVVLSGDPLSRITDTLRIEATVKNGIWRDRSELLNPP